jgi:hypothetical protein
MPFCTECGVEMLLDEQKYCRVCGTKEEISIEMHRARGHSEGKVLTMPVTYSDLDVGIDGEFRELKIWVSEDEAKGYVKAKGYIDHGHSARIRILFEESQSLIPEQEFVTKYFDLDERGCLYWGKEGENLWILRHREASDKKKLKYYIDHIFPRELDAVRAALNDDDESMG